MLCILNLGTVRMLCNLYVGPGSPFSFIMNYTIHTNRIWNLHVSILPFIYCHTRLHLEFSDKLKIWQVPACNIEPRSGNTSWKNHPPTHQPYRFSQLECAVPPLLFSHLRILCGVPTFVWISDQIPSNWMCDVPSFLRILCGVPP